MSCVLTLSQAPTPVTYLSVHVNEIEYSEIENRVPLNCIAVTFNAMNNNTCRPCRRTHQPSVRDRAGKLVSTCDARLKLDSCPGQQKSSQGGGRHARAGVNHGKVSREGSWGMGMASLPQALQMRPLRGRCPTAARCRADETVDEFSSPEDRI